MGRPFELFDGGKPDPAMRELVLSIEARYRDLEKTFDRLSATDRRLKALPGSPMPSLSAPYEFGAIQALRALGLVEGAAMLIERSNWPAAFPVLRSLFEVWVALSYANIMFRKLVLKGAKWHRYDEIAIRLLRGRTDSPDAEVIQIGHMLDEVKRSFSRSEAVSFVRDTYDQLSDFTHPTIWGMVFHLEERPDGLGTILYREPRVGGLSGPLFDLNMLLDLVQRSLRDLEDTMDRVWLAFSAGPGRDPKLIASAAAAAQMLREHPPELRPPRDALFRERANLLADWLHKQAAAPDEEEGLPET